MNSCETDVKWTFAIRESPAVFVCIWPQPQQSRHTEHTQSAPTVGDGRLLVVRIWLQPRLIKQTEHTHNGRQTHCLLFASGCSLERTPVTALSAALALWSATFLFSSDDFRSSLCVTDDDVQYNLDVTENDVRPSLRVIDKESTFSLCVKDYGSSFFLCVKSEDICSSLRVKDDVFDPSLRMLIRCSNRQVRSSNISTTMLALCSTVFLMSPKAFDLSHLFKAYIDIAYCYHTTNIHSNFLKSLEPALDPPLYLRTKQDQALSSQISHTAHFPRGNCVM